MEGIQFLSAEGWRAARVVRAERLIKRSYSNHENGLDNPVTRSCVEKEKVIEKLLCAVEFPVNSKSMLSQLNSRAEETKEIQMKRLFFGKASIVGYHEETEKENSQPINQPERIVVMEARLHS